MKFSSEVITHFLFFCVQKTKLKIVNSTFVVEVYLFKQKSKINDRKMNTHFIHASHELSEGKLTVKVFVECSETLTESFEFLVHAQINLLVHVVEPFHLRGHFHQRVAVHTVQKVH